ncbi:hypothetical protein RUM44_007361 [Polyplax serrata]|uniref:Uncharacterized protein n=1 Tax=Polyplax serrata TaxID=468196 RepID=A0ABR1B0F6_POLSC
MVIMNKDNAAFKRFLNTVVTVLFWLLLFLTLPSFCKGTDQHHHHHHHGHEHHEHHTHENPSFKYSREANEPHIYKQTSHSSHKIAEVNWMLWAEALGSTFFISAVPFFILFFVPLDKSKEKEPLLKILLSFASGGLLGDAFLHLIPHALVPHSSHSHDSHDSHEGEHGHDMKVGLSVLLGIVTFLLVEKSVRWINGGEHGHSHGGGDVSKKEKTRHDKGDPDAGKNTRGDKGKKTEKKKEGSILVSGYLNLAADFTHNFTDGLAIGASYLVGKNVGFITTVTILLHEVPHEIGDFAILIQSGCSKRKAMCLQLVTAVGAVMGTMTSLMAESAGDVATSWILPFTAGGFIYISTVSIIPELLRDTNFLQSVKEIFAMIVGVLLMVLIADFE